jgi:hypothetical protein
MVTVSKVLTQLSIPKKGIEIVRKKMTSGDYDYMLAIAIAYVGDLVRFDSENEDYTNRNLEDVDLSESGLGEYNPSHSRLSLYI